uniref:histidine kinase n=2 Tax=Candidatus Enterococcus mansonii TaxID=1834181 RepID=A0A242CDP2_9ENTE|nr:HAMP domain-containing sensor histidine kinase [Enterococcus sp. 4G2_DIV0659]OTO08040.1 hypothetical protein A5880_002310 [Enterococcus sp. 4G2_DIV0659]
MNSRTKTFLFTSTVISIVITSSFALLYFLLPVVYEKNKQDEAIQGAKEIIARLQNQPLEKIIETIKLEPMTSSTTSWALFDKEDNIVYPDTSVPIEDNTSKTAVIADAIVNIYKTTITDAKKNNYKLVVNMYLEPVRELKRTLIKIYPFILCISYLIGGVGAYVYSYWATRRIERISKRTKNMVILEEPTDYIVQGTDELSELENNIQFLYLSLLDNIHSLNKELEKTNAVEHSKSEFMRIASHELKTPITAMLGLIEGMILNVGRFKDRDYYLKVCKEILESQSQLVQDVLFISKLESIEKFEATKEQFSLTELIKETMTLFELMAVQKELNFEVDLEEVAVETNREDLKRVLMNLLSNALNYTKKQGTIKITLRAKRLIITNQCTPLEKEEIDKIFLPFYRPDYARARKDGGTGLGLYIVSKLLLKNNMVFTFEPMENESGMKFVLNIDPPAKTIE